MSSTVLVSLINKVLNAHLLLMVSICLQNGCLGNDEFITSETISTTPVIFDTSQQFSDSDVFNLFLGNNTPANYYNFSQGIPDTTQTVPNFETTSFYESEDSGYLPTEIFKEDVFEDSSEATIYHTTPTAHFTSPFGNSQYKVNEKSVYSTELSSLPNEYSSTEKYAGNLESSTESSSFEEDITLESLLRGEYGTLYEASNTRESVRHSTIPSFSFKQDKGFTGSLDRDTISIDSLEQVKVSTVSPEENKLTIVSLDQSTTHISLGQDTTSRASLDQDTTSRASLDQGTTSRASLDQGTTSRASLDQGTTSRASLDQDTSPDSLEQDTTSPASLDQDASPASLEQDDTSPASLEQDATSIASLEQDATSIASLEQDATSIASLEQDATSIASLEQGTTSPASLEQDTSPVSLGHDITSVPMDQETISTVSLRHKATLVSSGNSTTPESQETLLPVSITPSYKVKSEPAEASTEAYNPTTTTNISNDVLPKHTEANNAKEVAPSQTSSQCYDGPNVGTCKTYKQCSLSGGEAFAICKDGRFCCKLYNVDMKGVAYGKLSPSYGCGMRSRSLVREAKIIGGVEASFGEFPWQAYVFFSRGRAFCGGTLISNQWLITAAHCVYGLPSKYIHVRLGEYDLSHKFEPLAPINRNVKRVILHPDFNARGENDIALLQLNSPVEMQPNVIPICLPKVSTSYTNRMGIATGWGTTAWKGFTSNVLQKVSMPIISEEKCKLLIEGYHSSFLCAGYVEGTADSCLGDSGGPLQVRDPDGRFHLAGVVSWGEKCAQKGKVGVYASVTKFLPWITGHTKVSPQ